MGQTNNGNQIVVGTNILEVVATSKTRPADTNAYAAGDTISESTSVATVWTFSNVVRKAGGSGTIGQVFIDDSSSPALKLQSELWLFDTTVTADQDNARKERHVGNIDSDRQADRPSSVCGGHRDAGGRQGSAGDGA